MDKYRALIVGVGSIGERHLRCFQKSGRAEISFCEPGEQLRQTIAERYDVKEHYASLEEALDKGSFDLAVIATPAPLHVDQAIKVLSAGMHAMIEKPLSTNLHGLDQLQEVAAKSDRVITIGYTWRNHPALAAMRDAIASGKFGKPLHMINICGQHFPSFRPAYRDVYYAKHETGGGAIQDAITHMLNAGEWLLGPITKLVADADHQALEGVEVEDAVNVLVRHGDKVMGTYNFVQHQPHNELQITVICEKGTVRFEAHNARWRWTTTYEGPEQAADWHDEPVKPFERDAMYIWQAEAFMDAIEGKQPPRCSLQEGVQTLKVNLAALESARTGAWQTIK